MHWSGPALSGKVSRLLRLHPGRVVVLELMVEFSGIGT